MSQIIERFLELRREIETVCKQSDRHDSSVRIVAVSKKQAVDAIRTLFCHSNCRDFGENYVQEALQKMEMLQDLAITWHFIGQIQSNKITSIATHFHWVQSVSSLKQLEKLNQARPDELGPLQVCLQVNLDEEPQKAGFKVEDLSTILPKMASLTKLQLRGFMLIPMKTTHMAQTCASFKQMQLIFEKYQGMGVQLDTLSMGMSTDYLSAVRAGSTMVRIGTGIFGPRKS